MDRSIIEKIFKNEKKINTIILLLTEKCNLRCKYCYTANWSFDNRDKNDMSFDCIKSCIDFIKDKDKVKIIFSGGEPLLRFDLMKNTVEYVKIHCNSYNFGIVTNGTLINKKHREFFRMHNFHVTVSLDGMTMDTNKNRIYLNGKNSLKKSKQNLSMLLNDGIKITVRMTITEENVQFYNSFHQLALLGVKNFKILPVTEKGFKFENIKNCFYSEMDKVLDYCSKTKIVLFPYNKYSYLKSKDFFNSLQCGAGLTSIVIAYNGDIYACPMLKIPSFKLGNIFSKSDLKQIVFHHAMIDKCIKCEFITKCTSLCYARFQLLNGDMYNPDQEFCLMSQYYIAKIQNSRDKI